ncbi:MAG TPA: hypothetical protein VLF61_00900 [Rhabdochlamydiaceae bacterium]|nr:hypothetical protein [Rhabdochlamydiaceae bacterium]
MAINISKLDFTLWLQENQKKLYWILTLAFVPFSFLMYFAAKKSRSNWEDYLQAHFIYQKWAENPATTSDQFNQLLKLTNDHRGLQEKYGALIAEKCIALNETALVKSFTDRALDQIKDRMPLHHLFSKTSLLIAEGSFEAALKEALALKEKIENNKVIKQNSVLFLFNLIRIASLERILNQFDLELESLKSIRTWLISDQCTPEARLALSIAFQENKISFVDYINHRLTKE